MAETMCYVAAHPGQAGYFFASVIADDDSPQYIKDRAKRIAKLLRDGAVISRVPLSEASAGLSVYQRPPTVKTADLF